jgi:37-kD nucleoid-associated bacterial protein
MIKYLETGINNLVVHKIGNSRESSILNKEQLNFDRKNEQPIFVSFFLKAFANQVVVYNFFHEVERALNPIFKCCNDIFRNGNFIETSIKISDYLIGCSNHPNIKSGELFIVKFDEILFENIYCEAIGIFKTENKDSYFESIENKTELKLRLKQGISTNKFDKGCLILNTNEENGYKVCVIDNVNKGNEAFYWKDSFLKIVEEKNEFHQTNQFLGITKNFITKQFPTDFETTKADQIDLLNRSVQYFKKHETFDKQEFEKEVFHHVNIISSFNKFDTSYRQENEIEIADDFSISPQAVKKQERNFKSILKLDKNFHVYIHGDKTFIEKGVEKDGRKFYKLYYDTES